MGEHIAVLTNPSAGKGKGLSISQTVLRTLKNHREDVRLYQGVSRAETRELAIQALGEQPSVLVVVGGDGTLFSFLDVLIESEVPLVLVPGGTGNDLARALGIPRENAAEAAMAALTGIESRIDVGQAKTDQETTPFLTIAALGLDAKVSERTNQLKWPHGSLRYYLALVLELINLKPLDFTVKFDQEPAVSMAGTLIAVGNTATYGGGNPMCLGAQQDDGKLDIVHVKPLGRLRLIWLFPLLLRGKHLARPEVTHRKVRELHVSAPGLSMYADGERLGFGECVFTVLPKALSILLPSQDGTKDA